MSRYAGRNSGVLLMARSMLSRWLGVCLLAISIVGNFVFSSSEVFAATGLFRSLNWQARLLTSGGVNVADATYAVKFSIYDASTGGNRLWTAAGTTSSPSTVNVTVDDGLMTVLLGDSSSQNAFDFNWNQDSLYLGVTIGADSEMSPRKRLSSVPSAFVAETLQGNYASSSVTSTGGNLMNLRQTSTDAASASRTALLIETLGTSNVNDWLLRASNANQEVFSILRNGDTTTTGSFVTQGNIKLGDATTDLLTVTARFGSDLIPSTDLTYSIGSSSLKWLNLWAGSATFTRLDATTVSTTNFLATNATSSWIGATTVSTTSIYVNGSLLTGAGSQNLQQATNQGASTTNQVYLFGGASLSSLTVTSSASLQDVTFSVATGTSATVTQLYVASALTFQSASGQSLLITGKQVCLADGTNCPVSTDSATQHWVFASTTGALRPTTTTADIIFGSTATSSAVGGASAYFDMSDSSNGTSSFYFGYATNANVYIGTTTYGGGLGSSYFLDGNDALVQGKLGSIEGLFSATGVTIGTSTTVLADGALYKSNGGDFTFNLNNPGSNWRFRTTSTMDLLTVASSGFIGIRTSNPQAELDVKGSILNMIRREDQGLSRSGQFVATAYALEIVGRYAYLSGGDKLRIVDISDPTRPQSIGAVTLGVGARGVAVANGFAYVADWSSNLLYTVDIRNPATPFVVNSLATPSTPHTLKVSQGLLFLVSHNQTMTIYTISNPALPALLKTVTGFSEPWDLQVDGTFAYISNRNSGSTSTVSIVDISNPLNAAIIGSVSVGQGASGLEKNGAYVYTANYASNTVSIVDVSNPLSPTLVTSTSGLATPQALSVSGKHALVASGGSSISLQLLDISSSTAPFFLGEPRLLSGSSTALVWRGGVFGAAVGDRWQFGTVTGTTLGSLSAASAEMGNVSVQQSGSVAGSLSTGGLWVGMSGLSVMGAFAITATNTTSTFYFAVSSTAGEFSSRIRAGGQLVCLDTGIDCSLSAFPVGSRVWTEAATNNLYYVSTGTRDVIIGGSATTSAHFTFDSGPGTSTVLLAQSTNTNILIGTSSYEGGLANFGLGGNDLLAQGAIGSIGGLFSATGVRVGATNTSFILEGIGSYRPSSTADYVFQQSSESASMQFQTGGIGRLTIASSGNIGIGLSNPQESLDVSGKIQNNISNFNFIHATTNLVRTVQNGGTSHTGLMRKQGNYLYIAWGRVLTIVDVTDQNFPVEATSTIVHVAAASEPMNILVNDGMAFIYYTNGGSLELSIVDISNPWVPRKMSELTAIGGTAQGGMAYSKGFLVLAGTSQLNVLDVRNPRSPFRTHAITLTQSCIPPYVDWQNELLVVGCQPGANNSVRYFNTVATTTGYTFQQFATSTFSQTMADHVLRGRYLYVGTRSTPSIKVYDVADPTTPVTSTNLLESSLTDPYDMQTFGDLMFIHDATDMNILDITSSTNIRTVATTTWATNGACPLAQASMVYDRGYLWCVTNLGAPGAVLSRYDLKVGLETSSLKVASGQIGQLNTQKMSVFGSLFAGDWVMIGQMGVSSMGSIHTGSTNTTSTFMHAIQAMDGEFSSRLTLNRTSVCLASGVNCVTGINAWTENSTSNTTYITTNQRDLIIGGSSTSSAHFTYDAGPGTSTVLFAQSTNTNILIGTSSYQGGLLNFGLGGNDLLSQGMIGSIDGMFSATGIRIGATNTQFLVPGTADIRTSSTGDFQYLFNSPASNWRFQTSSTERLLVTSSGNIGIGVSNPTESVQVQGDIFVNGTGTQIFANSTYLGGVETVAANGVAVQGSYFYVVTNGSTLNIYDITSPPSSTRIASVGLGSTAEALVVRGSYAYIPLATGLRVVDISNPTSPRLISQNTNIAVACGGVVAQGNTLFLGCQGSLRAVDITNPNAVIEVGNVATSSGYLAASIQGNYLHLVSDGGVGVQYYQIFDVSNTRNMTLVRQISRANPESVTVQGNYAFVGTANGNDNFAVIDISVATSARIVATSTQTAVDNFSGDMVAVGKYLFTQTSAGMNVFDISSSTRPILIRRFTVSTVPATGIRGLTVQGKRVFLALAASSGRSNAMSLDIMNLETPAIQAYSAETALLSVRNDLTVMGHFSTKIGGMNIGSGGIYSQGGLGIYTSSTVTSTIMHNPASSTVAVLAVKSGCITESGATIFQVGNRDDDLKFRVQCNGDVQADGAFMSPAADFAEYFPSMDVLSPGTVVALSSDGAGMPRAILATSSLRPQTLGVVSESPSFIGAADEAALAGSASRTAVALFGRISVSAQGPISSGDILMAGIDGKAVRASGTGMILGTSVSSVNTGVDATIPIFLNPQWWAGDLFGTSSTTPYSNLLLSNLYIPSNVANASTNYFSSSELSFATSKWNGAAAQNYRFNLLASSNASSSFLEVKGILPDNSSSTLFSINASGTVQASQDLRAGRNLVINTSSTRPVSIGVQTGSSTYVVTDADGWSTSGTFDYAEQFPATEKLEAGDLVMVDPQGEERVQKTQGVSSIPIGIVSTKPAFIAGRNTPGTYPIALAGRVPLKINQEGGSIAPGDPLSASSMPGVAKRAADGEPIAAWAMQSPVEGSSTIIAFVLAGKWSTEANGQVVAVSEVPPVTAAQARAPAIRVGMAEIRSGDTVVSVRFAPVEGDPVIHIRPYGTVPDNAYWLEQILPGSFEIRVGSAMASDIRFSWRVIPSTVSMVQTAVIEASTTTTVATTTEDTAPISSGQITQGTSTEP